MTAAPVVLPRQIAQALEHVESLCNFAYEQGFHELGYDPIETLRAAIASGSVVCRVADEWRSIENAPPMTYVLVGRDMGEPWGFVRGTGYFKEGSISGWVCRGICDPPGELGLGNPTHWQSLPAPPKERSNG